MCRTAMSELLRLRVERGEDTTFKVTKRPGGVWVVEAPKKVSQIRNTPGCFQVKIRLVCGK